MNERRRDFGRWHYYPECVIMQLCTVDREPSSNKKDLEKDRYINKMKRIERKRKNGEETLEIETALQRKNMLTTTRRYSNWW